jgi:hypothetical protein
MSQVQPVNLGFSRPAQAPAKAEPIPSSNQPVSMHRALASAISGFKGNPDSSNPHEAAVGKLQQVNLGQDLPKKTGPTSATPVSLGSGQ